MMRSPGSTRGGAQRPRGTGRDGGAGRCSSASAPSRTSHTRTVPPGVRAATSGSSTICRRSAPGGTCGPNPSMWYVNTGAPSAKTRSCPARRSTMRSRIAGRNPAKSGWRSGKLQRGDIGLTHTSAWWRSASATTCIPRAVAIDAGPDHEHRALTAIEPRGEGVDEGGIRKAEPADRSRRDQLAVALPVVHRNRHERRPAGLLHRHVVGAGNRGRHVLAARRLAAPLHVGLRQRRRVGGREKRLVGQDRSRLLAGGDDERRAVAIGGEDVAHGVTDAGCRVQVDDGRVAGGLREAVRHADDDRLLQPQHVAEVVGKVLEQRQLGGAGVAEDGGHPQLAQQADDGVADCSHAGAHYARQRNRGMEIRPARAYSRRRASIPPRRLRPLRACSDLGRHASARDVGRIPRRRRLVAVHVSRPDHAVQRVAARGGVELPGGSALVHVWSIDGGRAALRARRRQRSGRAECRHRRQGVDSSSSRRRRHARRQLLAQR